MIDIELKREKVTWKDEEGEKRLSHELTKYDAIYFLFQ